MWLSGRNQKDSAVPFLTSFITGLIFLLYYFFCFKSVFNSPEGIVRRICSFLIFYCSYLYPVNCWYLDVLCFSSLLLIFINIFLLGLSNYLSNTKGKSHLLFCSATVTTHGSLLPSCTITYTVSMTTMLFSAFINSLVSISIFFLKISAKKAIPPTLFFKNAYFLVLVILLFHSTQTLPT